MRLETIIETCAEPIVVYDKKGIPTYVNPGFERVFGWKGQELVGRRIDFVPRDQAELTRQAVATVIAGHRFEGLETQRKTKNGGILHVRLSGAPLKDAAGNYDGMVVTLQDISDLVVSRQDAMAANQAKGEFLSNVSHEFRTPMNHIMGMIDLLLNTRLDEEQQEFVEILQKSADSLMAMVNDMLDYSRIEAGGLACDCIGFDLQTLLEKLETQMSRKAGKKGLAFCISVHQFVPCLLMGDPGRLRQVLTHLCSNAIKFTAKGGVKINVLLEKEDDHTADIRFEVIDTGIGIAMDQTRVIFDSFFQADGSVTRKYGGTGLGLSISNRLVQMMGSAINVNSYPGKGSTFFFTLSLDKQALGAQRNIAVPLSFQGKRILVVDDNTMDRRVLKTLILDWGCLFDEAGTPEAALEKMKTNADTGYDILLLNMELPGMGGEALAKEIKSCAKASALIIMLATAGKSGDVERLRKTGLNGYLPKPIKPSDLYDCIATALAMKYSGKKGMITRHALRENKKQQVKILLVEAGQVHRKVILNILNRSGYRAKVKTDLDRSFEAVKTGNYNLILLDMDRPESLDMVHILRRYERETKKGRVPIIAMATPPMDEKRKGKYREQTDVCLLKPVSPAELTGAIEKWTWQNESFLRTHVGGYSRMQSRKTHGIVFNFKAALERAMDDKEFLGMLVNEFMGSLSVKIAAIQEAVLKKDIGDVMAMAQSLKGSSANMGADMISAIAQAIETYSEKGDLSLVETKLAQLENESVRFKEHITTIKWSEV